MECSIYGESFVAILIKERQKGITLKIGQILCVDMTSFLGTCHDMKFYMLPYPK